MQEFYRIVNSRGPAGPRMQAADSCLISLARATGLSGDDLEAAHERGLYVIAAEDTDDAAVALTRYAIEHLGSNATFAAKALAYMHAPIATRALDEIVTKTRGQFIHDYIVRSRELRDRVLVERQQPITHVIVDTRNVAEAPGYRIARSSPARDLQGWIRADGSHTLGGRAAAEVDRDELVFNTARDAYSYATRHGWIVVNRAELER